MYLVELFTTKKCNQSCYYCNVFRKDNLIVDIDYLKYVLNLLPNDCAVEITGGEIGLLKNLDEVFQTIYGHKNISKIYALSNGLIRKKGVDWLDKVEYWEHLVYDIHEKEIELFYDLPLDLNHVYVIVMTEKTTRSILKHWDYFEKNGLFEKRFWFKMMNSKTHDISNYHKLLWGIYYIKKDKYHLEMIKSFRDKFYMMDRKIVCAKNSPNPFIDLQSKRLGHCSIFFDDTKTVPFNKENLELLMKCKLFGYTKYCEKCYNFDPGIDKPKFIEECSQGKYSNVSYRL
jgi:hypothetical protein